MDNEEAIEVLYVIRMSCSRTEREAIDLAIAALEEKDELKVQRQNQLYNV